ncbi:MAG TPA: PAS domain-containing sensor histidine kinase [Kofleriaceae bacterium]|nr:PAS domain-containing sensor histidine kinase [Kofleriaceae bacterium]
MQARLGDAAARELAAQALRALVRSLRAADAGPAAFSGAVDVDALTRTMRVLGAEVLDAIELAVSATQIRPVAAWFAAVSEHALGEASRRFAAMLDALDDHVILLDPSARVLFLNRPAGETARAIYGRSREEMIGTSALDGPQAQQHKQYVLGLVARAGQGETIAEEFLLPMPDGAIWHEHHLRPVVGPGGQVEAVAISSREIHARKQAEGRLQLLSKIGLLAATNELDGVLARAAGLAIPELADWSVFELVQDGHVQCGTVVHPDAERAAQARQLLIESRRSTPSRVDGAELGARLYRIGPGEDDALQARDPELHAVLRRFDATTAIVVPFVVMAAPIAIATFVFGPESGRRHAPADLEIAAEIARRAAQIVENARLHAELGQALAYRERVMGILGHDLRNPVSAVLSLSSTLAQRADVPERSRDGLRHIHRSAERMEQMIATILDFTQLRFRGAPSLAREAFDLESLVRTVVDELRAAHPGRDIALDARGELRGRWDVSRMGQVISNLVGNALTHGARESPVTVGLTSDNDSVLLAVTNRGPTIPGEALGRLFEPFWRGPEGGASRSRGLGLGLFIAQQIVQAHGGGIVVRSHDERTTFTVRLPR